MLPATSLCIQFRRLHTNWKYGPIADLSKEAEKRLLQFRCKRYDGVPDLVVYADSSLVRYNKSRLSSTGIAFLVHDSPFKHMRCLLDVSQHNSGFGEIRAAAEALSQIMWLRVYQGQRVILRMDYECTVLAMRRPCNPFTEFNAEHAALYRIAETFPRGVLFQHYYSHNGHLPNEQVDQMAFTAAWSHPQLLPYFRYAYKQKHRSDKRPERGIETLVLPKPLVVEPSGIMSPLSAAGLPHQVSLFS